MRASSAILHRAIMEEIGTFGQPTPEQTMIIKRVEGDYYNDFFGVPAMPIAALVADCRAVGLPGVAESAIRGTFDATQGEADEWAQSPEGQETFRQLIPDGE